MKVTITKNDLNSAVNVLSKISSKEKGLLSSCITFVKHGENQLLLSATNSRVVVQYLIPASFEDVYSSKEDNGFSIETKRFLKWFENTYNLELTFKFNKEDLKVIAKSNKGSLTFSSFPPDQFFDWERHLEGLKDTATVNALKLENVLKTLNSFSKEDNKNPQFSLLESKNGVIYSTNSVLIGRSFLKELEFSSLKVHTKEVGNICSYLSSIGSKDCKIKESDTTFLLETENSKLIFSNILHSFPDLSDPSLKEDDFFVTTTKVDLLEAINYLEAAASEDDCIKFDFVSSMDLETGNTFKVILKSYSGEDISQDIVVVDNADSSFSFKNEFSKANFLKVVSNYPNNIRMGFNAVGGASYIRYNFTINEVDFTVFQQSK